ncbi:hypothetical protein Clacol_005387 [Clathrus columnatus]|uniref:Chromo domain-containing protein n=1 Tax=Clathrus columnatus TaxID=1419009 RepID=A0AAV5ADS9_9AGAM|nr:hypothetical protein Clacol_005387 [Clathrus columnatus]
MPKSAPKEVVEDSEEEQVTKSNRKSNSKARGSPMDVDEAENQDENNDGGEEGEEEEEEEEEEFEIEAIKDAKPGVFEGGAIGYLVRWKGYGPEHDSWVTESDAEHANNIKPTRGRGRPSKASDNDERPSSTQKRKKSTSVSAPTRQQRASKEVEEGKETKEEVEEEEVEEPSKPAKKARIVSSKLSSKNGTSKPLTQRESPEIEGEEAAAEYRPTDADLNAKTSWEKVVKTVDTIENVEDDLKAMDDPWSTNAWSTEDDKEVSFQINHLAPKWETSEHDAEFHAESGNTLDPSLPSSSSWSIPSGSAWDVGNDVWNTNVDASYNKPWNSKEPIIVSTQTIPETVEEPSEKLADLVTVRPALPTPPSSPLTAPSRVAPGIIETDVQTLDIPEVPTALATPDHFGSFESAQETKPVTYSDDETFWPKETVFETQDSFEEPWKSTWESPVDEDTIDSQQPKDDWEIAQDTQRRLNERIPQELLRLIISRWEAIVEEHYSQYVLPGELDYSWRKGLDNVPGLSERVDNFIPSSYFSLPTPFPKSQIAKAVKESLRLSRSYVLSQSSPMAQFYASKSSLEWENSVKMQKSTANDEWGWDLKQVKEETLEAQEAGKETERKAGFLSFWKRRTASESTTATSNTQPELPQPEKKEQTPAVPAPTASLRPSLENPPSAPLSPKATPLSESTVSPTTDITTDYDQPPQPSVVSRFFSRLSRRPASGIIVETAEHSPSSASVSLSADDLAFLSDIVPSDPTPRLSSSVHKSSGSTGSLGDVLSFNTAKKDQLPAPLAPPPTSSRISPAAEGLKKKVKQGVDVIDLFGDDLTNSSTSVDRIPHLGGANLLFEDISIFENKPSIPEKKLSMTLDLSPLASSSSSRIDASTPPNLQQPPPQLLHLQPRVSSSSFGSAALIPPPPSKFGHSKPSVESHPVVSLSSSISQHSLDDFSDFVSGNPNHIESTKNPLSNPVFDNNDTSNDFGDFGDFVSTPQFSQRQQEPFKNNPTLYSTSKAQAESFTKGDFRGSSSVTIPILKPPPKFTTVGSDSISRNTDKNRVRSPPLSGKSSPLPAQPQVPLKTELRPPQISQQQTASVFQPSIGKTTSTASSLNKSGLSAHDLSFFEDDIPKVLPTPGINWTPCGDNIECGRLTVPLDYHNTSSGVANLALARYLATNKTGYLGSILTNPGGPGGSGVNYIYRAGKRLSDAVDGRYDIAKCFNSQTAQDLFYAHTQQEMLLEWRNLSDPTDRDSFIRSVRRSDANNAALAKLCAEKSGEALRHVGTATVVRDIEFINNIIQGENNLINFWGFSYGTIIGSYLVNMFPDKVGRVVIDGVVDPELWANSRPSEWYKEDYVDTDKAFDNFLEACQTAGSTRCALADEKSTARSIGQAIDSLLVTLYDYPLPVTEANRPGILTSGMVKGAIFTAMYAPRNWPALAEKLSQAIKGNGTALMNDILTKIELNTSIKPQTAQAITAVTCVDTPPYPETVDKSVYIDQYIEEVVLTYEKTSKKFAALDLDLCHHWVPREVERFTGVNAKRVNALLKSSSRLVIQDGSGHCSSAMASLCTGKVLRGYWLEGELPPNGIVCPTSEVLFPPSPDSGVQSSWAQDDVRDSEDLRILENMKLLGEAVQSFLIESRK